MEQDEAARAAREHYDVCLTAYKAAADALSEARRALTKLDVYLSPPPSPRFRLCDERKGVTYKVEIMSGEQPFEGYIRTGNFTDGKLGEVFINAEKMGSFVSGILDAVATSISVGLQHGVPLRWYVDKFKHTRFEPAGFTRHPEIGQATSVLDYLVRWLEIKYQQPEDEDGTSE